MARVIRHLFILFFALVLLMPAMARGSSDENEVLQSEQTQRIVQAGSSAFIVENALYLFPEAKTQVVALADGNQGNGFFVGDIDPNIDTKEVLSRMVNAETIIALNPGVVVMKDFLKKRLGEPIERVGIKTLYLDLETPEAWNRDLQLLGELFDNPERAEELQGLFDRRITAAKAPLEGLAEADKPRVLFLYWSVKDGVSAVNIPPLSFIQTRMIEMAGGIPVWRDADLDERWTRTGIEQIAAWDPDTIIVTAYHIATGDAISAIENDPAWASLRAVKDSRLYAVPADYHSWDQPDVRWLLGLQWLAKTLHPEQFPDIDMLSETRVFYREMFGMDDTEFDKLVLPKLSLLN